MNDLRTLYRDAVQRHAAQPVGLGRIIKATHRHEALNPLCGDRVEVHLRVVKGRIEEAAFEGEACALCMASASLLCQMLPGQNTRAVTTLQEGLAADLGAGVEPAANDPLAPLYGVIGYPSRIQCVTLPWAAAADAIASGRLDPS